jgi:hypothetical protein
LLDFGNENASSDGMNRARGQIHTVAGSRLETVQTIRDLSGR